MRYNIASFYEKRERKENDMILCIATAPCRV